MIDLVWTSENCAHIMEQLASAKYPPPIEKSNAMSHSGNAMPGPTNGHTGPTVSRDKTYRILGVRGEELNPAGGIITTPLAQTSQYPSGVLNIFLVNLMYHLVSLFPSSLLLFSSYSSFQVSDENVTLMKASIRSH